MAETYALGAKIQRHARALMRRLERLEGQIRRATAEVRGDALVAHIRKGEVQRRLGLFSALQIETLHLAADASEQLQY